jgi:hypothetical protein
MKKTLLSGIVLCALTLFFIGKSFGLSISYTNEADWLSAVTNVITEDYESYAWTGIGGDQLDVGTVTLGSITYSFPEALFGNSPNVTYDAAYLTGNYLEWQNSPNPLTINFNQSITAFSFDFGEFYGNGGLNLSVTLGNGDSFLATNTENSYSFFGVSSDASFTSITLNSDRNYVVMDNLSYAPVPEPSTMLLFSAGLFGLVGFARRKQK